MSRRFRDRDFEVDNKIIDLNDMKSVFREYIMMKIDEDFENMIKKYFENKDEFKLKV